MSQVNNNEPSLSGFENANAARFSSFDCLAARLLLLSCSLFGVLVLGCLYRDAKAAELPRPGKKLETTTIQLVKKLSTITTIAESKGRIAFDFLTSWWYIHDDNFNSIRHSEKVKKCR